MLYDYMPIQFELYSLTTEFERIVSAAKEESAKKKEIELGIGVLLRLGDMVEFTENGMHILQSTVFKSFHMCIYKERNRSQKYARRQKRHKRHWHAKK